LGRAITSDRVLDLLRIGLRQAKCFFWKVKEIIAWSPHTRAATIRQAYCLQIDEIKGEFTDHTRIAPIIRRATMPVIYSHMLSLRKEGAAVLENKEILPGTAIATFVNGRYPNLRSGNHAVFFASQAVN
jgi:hypothetical protein